MKTLLYIARLVDVLNERIGRATSWLVLAAVLISAGNAAVRKAFDISSNGFLEVQWYLFAAIFLLCAGYTLLRQEHVRIDIILGRFSRPAQVKVEIFGFLFFLLPMALGFIGLVWPLVVKAFVSGEMSGNAGGLIRWPVYALVPVGFTLLAMQGVSELIKRVAFLQGRIDDPGRKTQEKTAEEELAEVIRRRAEGGRS